MTKPDLWTSHILFAMFCNDVSVSSGFLLFACKAITLVDFLLLVLLRKIRRSRSAIMEEHVGKKSNDPAHFVVLAAVTVTALAFAFLWVLFKRRKTSAERKKTSAEQDLDESRAATNDSPPAAPRQGIDYEEDLEEFIRNVPSQKDDPMSQSTEKLDTLKATHWNSRVSTVSQMHHKINPREYTSKWALCQLSTNSTYPSTGMTQSRDLTGVEAEHEDLSSNQLEWVERLPESVGYLQSLVELDLSSTGITELPDSIGNLQNLKVLRIDGSCIRKLPDAIGMAKKLEELHALKSESLEEIPSNFVCLPYLRILRLSRTAIMRIPKLPASLTSLQIESRSTSTIPDLSNLINLRDLDLDLSSSRDPSHLQTPGPSWIGNLSKLEHLKLSLSNIVSLPPSLGSLSGLKKLELLSCVNLKSLPMLPTSLTELSIRNCVSIKALPRVSNLENLLIFGLAETQVTEIEGLRGLVSLKHLDIQRCKIENLDGLEQLQNISTLKVSTCEFLQRMPDLSNLLKLRELRLLHCTNMFEIRGLEELECLEELWIQHCISLQRLPNLSNLKKLKVLNVSKCEKIHSIHGIEDLNSLKDLTVYGCEAESSPNVCLAKERVLQQHWQVSGLFKNLSW
ncbi:hypothetical protein NL676_021776 [Syzygium grande]|nr:hypothetical protein NL676_021776 [Syzygium grande]